MSRRRSMSASRQLACNPVAAAVAKARFADAVRLCQVDVYLREHGSDAADFLTKLAEVLEVTMMGLEAEQRTDTPEHRLLRAAMNLLVELAKGGFKWRSDAAPTLDAALQRVRTVKFKAGTIHLAYAELQRRQGVPHA